MPHELTEIKKNHHFEVIVFCWEPVAKVMKVEARHTQRRDRALGVPPDILEHLPPKNQSLTTLLLCALTSDFMGAAPHHHLALSKKS